MSFNAEDAKGFAKGAEKKTAEVTSCAARLAPPILQRKRATPAILGWAALVCGGLAGFMILYHFAPSQYAFYPRCLFHSLTGLSCPGCGSLRALHNLLHGHWAAAFHFNPLLMVLLPLLPGALISYLLKAITGRELFSIFKRPFWIWLLFGAIVAFGILRNLPFGPLSAFRL